MGKLRAKIGFENVQEFLSGAAPLLKNLRDYFLSLGIYIINCYGLSETTGAITVQYPHQKNVYFPQSCGTKLPISEIKIDEESQEILCRGRTIFMGYLNQEEKTKSVFNEHGYFHSGDLGKVNEEGYIFITGRKKEIIVTAGGENVAPYPIENNIKKKLRGFASWVVVVGDNRKFLTALIAVRNKN